MSGSSTQRLGVLLVSLVGLLGAAWLPPHRFFVAARISLPPLAYVVGSEITLHADGVRPKHQWVTRGVGSIVTRNRVHYLLLAHPGSSQVIVSDGRAIASARLHVLPAPRADLPLLLVACYDDGVAIYNATSLHFEGMLATGGSPSDVATSGRDAVVTDNDGSALTRIVRSPWKVTHLAIPATDEVASDARGTFFATIRDAGGHGEVARIGNHISIMPTGVTAEGVAVDSRRHLLYVANINDGSIAVLNSRTLVTEHRTIVGQRIFSLALSPGGRTLYATRNGGLSRDDGEVLALATRPELRVILRSKRLTLPLGIAFDPASNRLFVTDEARNQVVVLDSRTLAQVHRPLPTCQTPWKPLFDARSDRLFIPCARGGELDIFNATTLARVRGAPLHTGGYPLAAALWRPARTQ